MSWTRLDDTFVHDQVWDHVDLAGRWHYLCLVQFCSRTHRYSGLVPASHAQGCSGLDPTEVERAHDQLAAVGRIVVETDSIRVVRIDDHLPPPHLRDQSRKAASSASTAAWRERRCDRGEHSKDCPRSTCPLKLARDAPREPARDQSRQDRTGQDGHSEQPPTEMEPQPLIPDTAEQTGGDSDDLDFIPRAG